MAASSSSDSSSDDRGSWGAFGTVVIIQLVIFIILYLAWYILRRWSKTKYFMAPRYYDQTDDETRLPSPLGFLSWVPNSMRFKEEDVFAMRGLDASLYLRFLKYMTVLFLLFIPISIGCLLPVDVTSRNQSLDETLRGIPRLAVGNISETSARLYAHAVAALIFTLVVLAMCYRLYKKWFAQRTTWMLRDSPHNYTVMYVSTSKIVGDPEEFFRTKFGNEVVDVQFTVDAGDYNKVAAEWGETARNLRFAQASLDEKGVRPTHKKKPLFGEQVDSIDYYTTHIDQLTQTLERKRATFTATNKRAHIGFVTFSTVAQAYAHAKEKTVMGPGFHFKAYPAPEEYDAEWEDMSKSPAWRRTWTPIIIATVAFLIIFWSAITVFAQGLVNLEALSKTSGFSWLGGVLAWSPVLTGFISGYLPGLIVTILTALLPKILQALVRLRGSNSKGQTARSVAKMYFIFVIINVFLVSLFVGGALWVVNDIANSSTSVLTLLGNGVPSQAIFFLNFVIVYALLKLPLQLLRVGPLFKALFLSWRADSQFESNEVQQQQPLNYQVLYGVDLLFFVIGFTYSVIQPFIIPWMVMLFLINFVVSKYLILYSQAPEYDSGGLFWPGMFHRICGGMFLCHLIIIGVLILKKSPAIAIVAICPFITLGFAIWLHRRFHNNSYYLVDSKFPVAPNDGRRFVNIYRDPLLHFDFRYNKDNNWRLPTDPVFRANAHKKEENPFRPSAADANDEDHAGSEHGRLTPLAERFGLKGIRRRSSTPAAAAPTVATGSPKAQSPSLRGSSALSSSAALKNSAGGSGLRSSVGNSKSE